MMKCSTEVSVQIHPNELVGMDVGGVGTENTLPGTVNAAIVAYYTSSDFGCLVQGAQRARRAVLEQFREQHGDKRIALLPAKFVAGTVANMQPHVARLWLRAVRALVQFAVAKGMRDDDPTIGIEVPSAKGISRRSRSTAKHAQPSTNIEWMTRRYVYVISGDSGDRGPVKIGVGNDPRAFA